MKKIIYISSNIYPFDAGDALHSSGMCKALNKICELYVFSYIRDIKLIDDAKNNFADMNVRFYKNHGSTKFDKFIARSAFTNTVDKKCLRDIIQCIKSENIDIIVIDQIKMVRFFSVLKPKFPQIKFVYISHNAEFKNIYKCKLMTNNEEAGFEHFLFGNDIAIRIRCWLHTRQEKKIIKQSDSILSISKEDIEILCSQYNENSHKFVLSKPLIQFNTQIRNSDRWKHFDKKLLIVGTMDWYPNVKGILWFVNQVFVPILEKDQSYKLYLVGNKPSEEIKELASRYPDNIIVTGFVESTDPYFNICDISIIPVFEGTGTKIKVLESVAKRIPTISTSFSAKDYKDIEKVIKIADDKEAMLESIELLKNDANIRKNVELQMAQYYEDYMNISDEVAALFI